VSANHILQNFLSGENFPEWKWAFTVKPVLSGTALSGHPLLSRHLIKSQNFHNVISVEVTFFKRFDSAQQINSS
jgi:hypothetical protein